MSWLSSGRVANPALDQVLLDTGAVVDGIYFFDVFAASTIAAAFELQHRNSTNLANIDSQIIAVPAFASSWGFAVPQTLCIPMAAGERIRLIQVAAVVGSVSVSIVGNF